MSKKPRQFNKQEKQMLKNLDELKVYDEFKANILPKLQQLLIKGKSAEEILAEYEAYAAARLVTVLATETDSGKALATARELLDRTQGKSKERKETTHRYQKLKDEELDSLLETMIVEVEDENG